MKCREWYTDKAKDNLRAGMFGRVYTCIDIVELKRNKCPECGWVSKYDEDGYIIKAEDRRGTLQEIKDKMEWFTKSNAEMRIHMRTLDMQRKAELAKNWSIEEIFKLKKPEPCKTI